VVLWRRLGGSVYLDIGTTWITCGAYVHRYSCWGFQVVCIQLFLSLCTCRSHVAPLWSWMDKVLPSLDKSEPVHGDASTVDSLKSAHNVSGL